MKRITLRALTLTLLCSAAAADRGRPGSLLVFPEWDARDGAITIFTVTNTHATQSIQVSLRIKPEDFCLSTSHAPLGTVPPGETARMVLDDSSIQWGDRRGYAFAYAGSPLHPVKFDALIGQATAIRAYDDFQYTAEPFAFLAGEDVAHGASTDLDLDGRPDLNGLEYEAAPNRLWFPSFLGQGYQQVESRLILVNLAAADPTLESAVDITAYNDNSEEYAFVAQLGCWASLPLDSISPWFGNHYLHFTTDDDPDEVAGMYVPGFGPQETGWFGVNGRQTTATITGDVFEDPAVLAMVVTSIDRSASFVTLPFTSGDQTDAALTQLAPEPGTASCFNATIPCPCQSPDGFQTGCRNFTGYGARLDASGSTIQSTAGAQRLRLTARYCPPNVPVMFLQGKSLNESPLYDGVLCVGVPTRRLELSQSSSDGGVTSTADLGAYADPGEVVHYQVWFRDPMGPCGGGSNLSNRYSVTWQ